MAQVDKQLAASKQPTRDQAQAALVAVDPRTGRDPRDRRRPRVQPLAIQPGGRRRVGSRAPPSNRSSIWRRSRRWRPTAARISRRPRSSTTSRRRSRTATTTTRRRNYQNEYDGPITLATRARPLAQHRRDQSRRNRRLRPGRESLDSGSASARRPNRSRRLRSASSKPRRSRWPRPTRSSRTAARSGRSRPSPNSSRTAQREVDSGAGDSALARPDTTFLVTNMMRSVLDEGTGAGARRAGFTLDAAGKTGTTNDLRDAWFIGFTPELLTAVWVGFDNNQPIGLSGGAGRAPDLDDLHETRDWPARRTRPFSRRRASSSPTSTRTRATRHAELPARHSRGLPRRHSTDRDVPRPRRWRGDVLQPGGQLPRPRLPLERSDRVVCRDSIGSAFEDAQSSSGPGSSAARGDDAVPWAGTRRYSRQRHFRRFPGDLRRFAILCVSTLHARLLTQRHAPSP